MHNKENISTMSIMKAVLFSKRTQNFDLGQLSIDGNEVLPRQKLMRPQKVNCLMIHQDLQLLEHLL